MPYLELPYIDFMIQRLHGADYGACVTEVHGRLQPFHAFTAGTPCLYWTLTSSAATAP